MTVTDFPVKTKKKTQNWNRQKRQKGKNKGKEELERNKATLALPTALSFHPKHRERFIPLQVWFASRLPTSLR